ncbi:MAG: hypothetical protein ACYC3O_11020 [Burkholderiales bacterium]
MMKLILILSILLIANSLALAADIDPFSGQSLAIEQTKAMVELTKMQNNLLEEQTKKAKAEFMLQNADKIFSAELKKQLAQAGGSGMGGRQNYAAEYPATRFPEPAAGSKKAGKGKKSADIAVSPPVMPAYTPPRDHVLLGILRRGSNRVAMIESGGEIVYAKVGDAVPGLGKIEQIADKSALIGGRVIAVEPVAVSNIDRQDIKTLAGIGPNGPGGTGGMPPAAMQSGFAGMPAASFPMSR